MSGLVVDEEAVVVLPLACRSVGEEVSFAAVARDRPDIAASNSSACHQQPNEGRPMIVAVDVVVCCSRSFDQPSSQDLHSWFPSCLRVVLVLFLFLLKRRIGRGAILFGLQFLKVNRSKRVSPTETTGQPAIDNNSWNTVPNDSNYV